jgi:hypothetical protein
MPCCHYCYTKYINEDGSIDYERFADAVDQREMEQGNLDHVGVCVAELKEAHDAGAIYVCTCNCHKDGCPVLH